MKNNIKKDWEQEKLLARALVIDFETYRNPVTEWMTELFISAPQGEKIRIHSAIRGDVFIGNSSHKGTKHTRSLFSI